MKFDVTNEKIVERIGFPFNYWAAYGQFPITEQDLKYLDIIKAHPCFATVLKGYQILSPIIEWANIRINKIVFYEHFYNDPNCPKGVKNILFTMIGNERGNLRDHNMLNLLNFRYHAVQLWIDSATKKSSL